MTRLHVRYDDAHFPEDLVFQETADRTNFQGRYVLRHEWKGQTIVRSGRPVSPRTAAAPRTRGAEPGVADRLGHRPDPPVHERWQDSTPRTDQMVAADLEVELHRGRRLHSRDRHVGVGRLTCAVFTAAGGAARDGVGHRARRNLSGWFKASRVRRPHLVLAGTGHARLPAPVRASRGMDARTGRRHCLQVLRTTYADARFGNRRAQYCTTRSAARARSKN